MKKKKQGVPKEAFPNSMTTATTRFGLLWRPNNYRRKIAIQRGDNSGRMALLFKLYKGLDVGLNSHNKLLTVRGFKPNITLQVGKNFLTGIYHQTIIGGHKEVFLIKADTLEQIQARIDERKQSIQDRIDVALKEFSRVLKCQIPYKRPVWTRYEDWVKGEEVIDSIPREVIVHDTVFKKVYGEGIEFIKKGAEQPTAHLKNYIKNRAIEDIAPGIAGSIDRFGERLDDMNALKAIKRNLKAVEDLFKPRLKYWVSLLSAEEKEDLELWMFNNLGVGV